MFRKKWFQLSLITIYKISQLTRKWRWQNLINSSLSMFDMVMHLYGNRSRILVLQTINENDECYTCQHALSFCITTPSSLCWPTRGVHLRSVRRTWWKLAIGHFNVIGSHLCWWCHTLDTLLRLQGFLDTEHTFWMW